MRYKAQLKELSGGYQQTTNNRMEIMAVIVGLEALKELCHVTLRSDSRYVLDTMEKGWAKRWRARAWKRNKKEKAINPDLWERILDLSESHQIEYEWVKGHSGDPDNERCDQLAETAARSDNLQIDAGYESGEAKGATSAQLQLG